ncbi:hypothetical protein [Paenibacillus sp. HB172176]|uniref:hypothetical protein n=1 Tax=Paenibacillus sp. HB172176 TaxID=2493690 RepID=UPI00143A8339|nr:hypothetical protein [Paenibacillus sp. HB172176]
MDKPSNPIANDIAYVEGSIDSMESREEVIRQVKLAIVERGFVTCKICNEPITEQDNLQILIYPVSGNNGIAVPIHREHAESAH